MSKLTRDEMQAEALANATQGQSAVNYAAIYAGFMARGIPESEIKPRENVFTFNAWKALGRSVKKRPADVAPGHYGVKVVTWVPIIDKDTGETVGRRPHEATVFHISQTEPTSEFDARNANRKPRRDYRPRDARMADNLRDYVRDPGEDAADRWTESNR